MLILLHNLGVKFNSPTVYLQVLLSDYVKFCENYEYYMKQNLIEITSDSMISEKQKISIGKNSCVKPYSVLYGRDVFIGDNVMIASHVVITNKKHNHKQVEKPMCFAGCIDEQEIVVEDDVLIGANSTLVPGAYISRGVVIGANSVVNTTIPSYAVAVGCPTKVINIDMIRKN
ncbi:MAG: DUF1919 domain-containing protein [Alphaproteobacteria bacterium]|nr:DUF1919 domain-containing protein [Alphaproteobacteria bacterium]